MCCGHLSRCSSTGQWHYDHHFKNHHRRQEFSLSLRIWDKAATIAAEESKISQTYCDCLFIFIDVTVSGYCKSVPSVRQSMQSLTLTFWRGWNKLLVAKDRNMRQPQLVFLSRQCSSSCHWKLRHFIGRLHEGCCPSFLFAHWLHYVCNNTTANFRSETYLVLLKGAMRKDTVMFCVTVYTSPYN